jgi:hypothetical protein
LTIGPIENRMTRFLGVVLSVAVAGACASGGSRPARGCDMTPLDTIPSRGPTYRECAVDRRAQQLPGGPRPDFRPPSPPHEGCYDAEVEFVVDANGAPVPGSIRVVRTNSSTFAGAVTQVIPAWRYRPAEKDGQPVGQLVREGRMLEVRVVVMPAGGVPPRPAPSSRTRC